MSPSRAVTAHRPPPLHLTPSLRTPSPWHPCSALQRGGGEQASGEIPRRPQGARAAAVAGGARKAGRPGRLRDGPGASRIRFPSPALRTMALAGRLCAGRPPPQPLHPTPYSPRPLSPLLPLPASPPLQSHQVDWFAPEDALPEEEALSEFLSEDMGMTPAEVAFFLPRLNEAILLEVEEGRVAVSSWFAAVARGGARGGEPRCHSRQLKSLLTTAGARIPKSPV